MEVSRRGANPDRAGIARRAAQATEKTKSSASPNQTQPAMMKNARTLVLS